MQIPGDVNSSTSMMSGFYHLKKFHLIGVIRSIPSRTRRRLQDILSPIHRELEQIAEKEDKKMRQAKAEKRRWKVEAEKQWRTAGMKSEMRAFFGMIELKRAAILKEA